MPDHGFAVIDFETTGFAPEYHHRVVEVAVVHVGPTGEIENRWETVVNPERDLGPVHIHGITGRDAMRAPLFSQIAPQLGALLDGRIVVAHNAQFEERFLRAELARLGVGSPVEQGGALCTMQLAREFLPGAGRSLADCCSAYDIELVNAHEALVDAEATARLLAAYLADNRGHETWDRYDRIAEQQSWPSLPLSPQQVDWVTRTRERDVPTTSTFLQRTTAALPETDEDSPRARAHAAYRAQLDVALADGLLTVDEMDGLRTLARELGIGDRVLGRLHERYFGDLAAVAWADGELTDAELSDLAQVALLLDLDDASVTAAISSPPSAPLTASPATVPAGPGKPQFELSRGDLVVLTGQMVQPRSHYEDLLLARDVIPWAAITKKVKLLVAADVDSLSGKARKARQYGIPIVGEQELLALLAAMRG